MNRQSNGGKNKKSRSGLEWPIGIAVVLLLFLSFLIGALVVLSGEQFDLVTKDYYEKGLAYQQRIDAIRRTQEIPDALRIIPDKKQNVLVFRFAPQFQGKPLSGKIYFYRPSNARQDKQVDLPASLTDDFVVPTEQLPKGKWRIKAEWQVDGQTYYYETVLYLE